MGVCAEINREPYTCELPMIIFFQSEQIRMTSDTLEKQHEDISFLLVNQQPIRLDMALPKVDIIACQIVVSKFCFQCFIVCKLVDNLEKQI